jgi:hypothetical protein
MFRYIHAFLITFATLATLPTVVHAHTSPIATIEVSLVRDDGRTFAHFNYDGRHDPGVWRRYVQAEHHARYRIRLRNNTPNRIGIVVAVDGRNAISGNRSTLTRSESMYVLSGYQTQWIDGWRTNLHNVRRFFFTDPGNSYAGAFGDESAMGVVAVAAYGEARRPVSVISKRENELANNRAHSRAEAKSPARHDAPLAKSATGEAALESHRSDASTARRYVPAAKERAVNADEKRGTRQAKVRPQAGTGLGERRHAPARYTQFSPSPQVLGRHFLKYEWRETLVSLGLIAPTSKNRFGPSAQVRDYGFVTIPRSQ